MSAGFVLSEGAKLFFKGRRVSFAATAVFAVVLSIIGIFALGTFYLVSFKNYVESRLEVTLFLAKDVDARTTLAQALALEGIADGTYVSSEEALAEFRTELGKDAELLEILKENPLPPSIRLRLEPAYRSLARLTSLEQKLKLLSGVEEVWIDRNLLSRLNTFLYVLLGADFFILLLVGLSAVLVTMIATRFAILDRRRIIDLYWHMGVSPRTLRAPYVIEGLFEGLFGSVISYAIVLLLHFAIAPFVGNMGFPYLVMLVILVSLGLLFGWMGSGIAIDAFKLKRQ